MGIFSLSAVLVVLLVSSVAVKEIHASYRLQLLEAPNDLHPGAPSPRVPERATQRNNLKKQVRAIEASGEMVGHISGLGHSNLSDGIAVLVLHESSQRVFRTKTNTEGRFRMRGLPSGEFRLGVERGADLVEFVGVKVLRGRTTSVNLELSLE